MEELGNNSENIEMAKMLSFESMNLGIMKSVKKPYDVVQSFTREHPEFFVDGSIVETCIRAMPHDQSFAQHIFDNVKYMGMNERKAKFFNTA